MSSVLLSMIINRLQYIPKNFNTFDFDCVSIIFAKMPVNETHCLKEPQLIYLVQVALLMFISLFGRGHSLSYVNYSEA